jgi:hypothetical protein
MNVIVTYTTTEMIEVDDRYKEITECDLDTKQGREKWDDLTDRLELDLNGIIGGDSLEIIEVVDENNSILYQY